MSSPFVKVITRKDMSDPVLYTKSTYYSPKEI